MDGDNYYYEGKFDDNYSTQDNDKWGEYIEWYDPSDYDATDTLININSFYGLTENIHNNPLDAFYFAIIINGTNNPTTTTDLIFRFHIQYK